MIFVTLKNKTYTLKLVYFETNLILIILFNY